MQLLEKLLFLLARKGKKQERRIRRSPKPFL